MVHRHFKYNIACSKFIDISLCLNLENEINPVDSEIVDGEDVVDDGNHDGDDDDGEDGFDDILVEKNDTEYLPSVSGSKKTSQSLLTVEEDETFHDAFKKLVKSSKPIYMKHVAEVIKKNTKLCHLLKNFTHRQLADRVRSMRKATLQEKARKSLKKGRK